MERAPWNQLVNLALLITGTEWIHRSAGTPRLFRSAVNVKKVLES